MHILSIGLNHHTAPVEIREKFAFAEQELPTALAMLKETKSILECVILATCNRTELYVVVDRNHLCGQFIKGFMEKWFQVPRSAFASQLYVHEDEEAIRHLFRVASGLDSMIVGETQILGQVRSAFLLAQEQQTTGTIFNRLFKQAITMAKRSHTETSINDNAVSISYAAVELGKRIFGSFQKKTVMIIGAGKMSELTVKHLRANGANKVIVANRTLQRAVDLAEEFSGLACGLDEVPEHLHEADIVISSTGAKGTVLTAGQVEDAMNRRRARPMFLIDIAVPRDLDPEINRLTNVFLYDIDDLEGIVESNLEQRRKAAMKIEEMIEAEIADFRHWYKTLGVSPVIRALQDKSAQIHEETLDSMRKKLPDLDEREWKVIRKLTKSMVNQMLHDPINRVKELAGEKHGEESLKLFAHIFALEEQLDEWKQSGAPADGIEGRANRLAEDKPYQPPHAQPHILPQA